MNEVTLKKIRRMTVAEVARSVTSVRSSRSDGTCENIDGSILRNRFLNDTSDVDLYYDWLNKQVDKGDALIIYELDRLVERWYANKGKLALVCDCPSDQFHAYSVRMALVQRIIHQIQGTNQCTNAMTC